MSTTCFEPEVSPSGRRLYEQYGIVCCTCIRFSSLVGSKVCSNMLDENQPQIKAFLNGTLCKVHDEKGERLLSVIIRNYKIRFIFTQYKPRKCTFSKL